MTGPSDAREHLLAAMDALQHSSRPPVSIGPASGSALAAGIGVALLGSASDGWLRGLTFVGGLALLALAFAVPHLLRRRAGVHGYRGPARRDNIVYLLVAVVLAVTGFGADSDLALIFDGLGVVVAVCWFLVLRGVLGTAR